MRVSCSWHISLLPCWSTTLTGVARWGPQTQARVEAERLAGENNTLREELGASLRKVHDLKAALHSTAASPVEGLEEDTFSNKKDEDDDFDVEANMLSGGVRAPRLLERTTAHGSCRGSFALRGLGIGFRGGSSPCISAWGDIYLA